MQEPLSKVPTAPSPLARGGSGSRLHMNDLPKQTQPTESFVYSYSQLTKAVVCPEARMAHTMQNELRKLTNIFATYFNIVKH